MEAGFAGLKQMARSRSFGPISITAMEPARVGVQHAAVDENVALPALAEVRVVNAVTGDEIVPWTSIIPGCIGERFLCTRPSQMFTFFHDNAPADKNFFIAAGKCMQFAAVISNVYTGLCRCIIISQIWSFPSMPPAVQDDPAIALKAVKYSGLFLQHCSQHCQNDEIIVQAAVAKDGDALRYASYSLRNNKRIVRAAITQCGRSLRWASRRCRQSFSLGLLAVRHAEAGIVFSHLDPRLQANKQLVLQAIRHVREDLATFLFCNVSKKLRRDKDVALTAVQRAGRALRYVHDDLKTDRQIVLAAVRNNGLALLYAAPILRSDIEVVGAAVSNTSAALKYADPKLLLVDVVSAIGDRKRRHSSCFPGAAQIPVALRQE